MQEVARQRLEADVATREAGRVWGFSWTLCWTTPCATRASSRTRPRQRFSDLPIAAKVYALSQDIQAPTARTFTPQILLEQPYRTGEMKVNPYMAFAILPGKATLSPAVDRWTEQATEWTSSVTRSFYQVIYAPNHPQHGQTVTSTSTSTEVVGTSQKALEYLRQIDVAFEVTGFGSGEVLQSITFDGIPVQAKEGQLTADDTGKLSGTFTIPAGVPAGTKLVVFRGGEGGSTAQATFVGQGTLEVTTLRQVQTVTNTNIDPLAQTFMWTRRCNWPVWICGSRPGETAACGCRSAK